MVDPDDLENDADTFTKLAEEYENKSDFHSAVFYITEAAQALLNSESAGSTRNDIRDRVKILLTKAEQLKKKSPGGSSSATGGHKTTSQYETDFTRAQYLMNEAISDDERGNSKEAVIIYTDAVELLLSLKANVSDDSQIEKIKKLAKYGLERAEYLKTKENNKPINPTSSSISSNSSRSSAAMKCSPSEIKVLRSTSTINRRQYPPFLDELDLYEKFALPQPFTIIYPQRQGAAVYNPCGKYMIKLHINGIPRKVIIDDYLPISHDGSLICSYSNNKSELWVSLLEKAYMKVMDGYDFPGSNSNIDLHALTGWIPERLSLRSIKSDHEKDVEFRRLLDRFHRGHCLITLATGKMNDSDAKRAGLVPTHAYAMLDIRDVNGLRLFLLKNPWSHCRWRGNYSELDDRNWTPALATKLNYDRTSAQNIDNGVFWIDYASLLHYFDVIYVNWSPDLFHYTNCVHDTWNAGEGPKKDSYSSSNNPQFKLEMTTKVDSPIWILLTRHITDKSDFAENTEFIAVVVYKNIESRKVYYTNQPVPFKDSVRINSPHCLVQMVQPPGTCSYTLVVSQYEKTNTINYTLRVYATNPFRFAKIADLYQVKLQFSGKWQGASAGGSPGRDSYDNNPCYQVSLPNSEIDNELLIEMRGSKNSAIGIELVCVESRNASAPNQTKRFLTRDYRHGYIYLEQVGLPGGTYNVVVSTYYPNDEGPFILEIKSARHAAVKQTRG